MRRWATRGAALRRLVRRRLALRRLRRQHGGAGRLVEHGLLRRHLVLVGGLGPRQGRDRSQRLGQPGRALGGAAHRRRRRVVRGVERRIDRRVEGGARRRLRPRLSSKRVHGGGGGLGVRGGRGGWRARLRGRPGDAGRQTEPVAFALPPKSRTWSSEQDSPPPHQSPDGPAVCGSGTPPVHTRSTIPLPVCTFQFARVRSTGWPAAGLDYVRSPSSSRAPLLGPLGPSRDPPVRFYLEPLSLLPPCGWHYFLAGCTGPEKAQASPRFISLGRSLSGMW